MLGMGNDREMFHPNITLTIFLVILTFAYHTYILTTLWY
jgi:hypothetical protein